MSSYDGKNFFEVLGAFCPGYKGYKEKEQRRDTDRVLRDAIVKRLMDKKSGVDAAMAELTRNKKFDLIEKLDSLNRKIQKITDQVKHAPRGYTGFFDTIQVKSDDLDRIYRYDLGLREKTEEVVKVLATLDGAGDLAKIDKALQELQEVVQHRTDALTEVS